MSKKTPLTNNSSDTSGGRQKTRFTGVYQRVHSSRRHMGKPDVCYDITYKDTTRKKIWEKVGWSSEGYSAALAFEIRSERLRQMRHNENPTIASQKSLTFAQAFAEFDKRHLYQLKSAKEDRRRFHAYLSNLHTKPLSAINPLDLEEIKRIMTTQQYSPQTIKHALSLVRRMFNKMSEWGLFNGKIPTVPMPRVDAARTRFLQPDEAEKLLTAIYKRSPVWHDIALLSLKTGMRLGEILALRFEDVDLINQTAFLRDAKAGSRTVILSDEACAVIKNKQRPFGLIFPARGTEGMGKSDKASRSFREAVKDVGLNYGITDNRQKVVFHTLRHTFASWLAIKGVPLYTIAELLGHKSIEMTQRYSHLCPDAKRKAVESIDNLL